MNITHSHRLAVGLAVLAALVPLWMFGALATEDDSPGPIVFGPLVVALIGATFARFRPPGVACALFAAAIAQALVASMEMIAWGQYLELSILNGFFMALWAGSALLFRRVARVSQALSAV
jgi:hypothetical protein